MIDFGLFFQMADIRWGVTVTQDESRIVAKYSAVVQYGYSLRQNAYRYAPLVAAGAALWSRASSLV